MKKISILLTLALCIISCQNKDEPIQLNDTPSDLNLDDVKHLIPLDLYKDGSVTIFKNSIGEEIAFVVSVSTEDVEYEIEGKSYSSEKLDIVLADSNDDDYGLVLGANAHHTESGIPSKFITGVLFTRDFNSVPTFWVESDREPITGTILETEKQLLDKSFVNVYSSYIVPSEVEAYSNIYYTIEQGFVGFHDKQDELWVLDRHE